MNNAPYSDLASIQMRLLSKGRRAQSLYKLHDYPVFIRTITKCGCTFLKNLIYYINYGSLHPLGNFIHNDESLLTRATPQDLPLAMVSPYVLIGLRNPFDRFLSLYFEKIYGDDPGSMQWFRKTIGKELDMNFEPDLSAEKHIENAIKLIDWIPINLAGETAAHMDFHWRPQNNRYQAIHHLEPKKLVLEHLNKQLLFYLGDLVPDLEAKMNHVRSHNTSQKPVDIKLMHVPELVSRIEKVYADDVTLYLSALDAWEKDQSTRHH